MRRPASSLVRHEETEESARGRCYGRLDVPLSAEGLRRAEELGAALAALPFAVCLHEPAEPVAPHGGARSPPPRAWSRSPTRATRARLRRARRPHVRRGPRRPRRGSTASGWRLRRGSASLAARGSRSCASACSRAVGEIRSRHAGEAVAVVAHGGVIRVVLADALGLADEAIFRLGQSHGGVSVVDWLEGRAGRARSSTPSYTRAHDAAGDRRRAHCRERDRLRRRREHERVLARAPARRARPRGQAAGGGARRRSRRSPSSCGPR